MSKLADNVCKLLKEMFPHNIVIEEYYVNYKGCKLFFDIYLKQYNILFEIQGQQHYKFVKHFHTDREGFLESKKRDNLKLAYVEENLIPLVIIKYNEKITKDIILKKILEAQKWVI